MTGLRHVLAVASVMMAATLAQASDENGGDARSTIVKKQSEPLSLAAWSQPEEPKKSDTPGETTAGRETEVTESGAESMTSRRLSEDDVAARQSVDAYNTLEDGQPGDPGTIELQLQAGWQTTSREHDPFFWLTELQFNLDGNEFLRNTQITLGVPLELGHGRVDGNADV